MTNFNLKHISITKGQLPAEKSLAVSFSSTETIVTRNWNYDMRGSGL
jgi:hypothetical protein